MRSQVPSATCRPGPVPRDHQSLDSLPWHHWDQVPVRNLQCDGWWITRFYEPLCEVKVTGYCKQLLLLGTNNMWAVRVWNLSQLRSPFKDCSCFRLALAARRCTSVSLHFQPRRCLYTFPHSPVSLYLCLSLFVSHFSLFQPTHALSLSILLTSSLLQSSVEGINQP